MNYSQKNKEGNSSANNNSVITPDFEAMLLQKTNKKFDHKQRHHKRHYIPYNKGRKVIMRLRD